MKSKLNITVTNEGQIEVKRDPMAYTMQSTLFNCSKTVGLAAGKTYTSNDDKKSEQSSKLFSDT